MIVLLACKSLLAQHSFSPNLDTTKASSRIGGAYSSFDLELLNPVSALPFTGFINGNTPCWKDFTKVNLFRFEKPEAPTSYRYSGIPHLGFAYAAGSFGHQTVHANYEQIIDSINLINISINRQSAADVGRNSSFEKNKILASYYRMGKRIKNQASINYSNTSGGINGGFDPDNLSTAGLEFAAPRKQNASAELKSVSMDLTNDLNLRADSSFLNIGFYSRHHLGIRHREYFESDDLASIYSQVNIDSLTTRDQFQENDLRNELGLKFSLGKLIAYSGFQHRYRQLRNLGRLNVANELNQSFGLEYSSFKWKVNYVGHLNYVGGSNENWNTLEARFRFRNRGYVSFRSNVQFRNRDLMIRRYFGNHLDYGFELYSGLQGVIDNELKLVLKGAKKFELEAGLKQLQREGTLIATESGWTPINSLNFSAIGAFVSPKYSWQWGSVRLKTFAQQGNPFMPSLALDGRLSMHKRVFEAQKMLLFLSVDYQNYTDYQMLQYFHLLDAFGESAQGVQARDALHLSTGFQIEEFKFFVRVENIQSLYIDYTRFEIIEGYYAIPFALRIGITWDLFN